MDSAKSATGMDSAKDLRLEIAPRTQSKSGFESNSETTAELGI